MHFSFLRYLFFLGVIILGMAMLGAAQSQPAKLTQLFMLNIAVMYQDGRIAATETELFSSRLKCLLSKAAFVKRISPIPQASAPIWRFHKDRPVGVTGVCTDVSVLLLHIEGADI